MTEISAFFSGFASQLKDGTDDELYLVGKTGAMLQGLKIGVDGPKIYVSDRSSDAFDLVRGNELRAHRRNDGR